MSSGPILTPRPEDVSSILGKRKFAFVEVPKLSLPARTFQYIFLPELEDSESDDDHTDEDSVDGACSDEDFQDENEGDPLEDDYGSELRARLEKVEVSRSRVKRFKCNWEGCTKAYRKPARLAEHIRSHTGERPFACQVCMKTYLRKSHLDAHVRIHASPSEKAFGCSFSGCDKRFWTSQDTKRHEKLHTCEKPYKCDYEKCDAAFAKHHQLRSHVAESHSPAGTKPYRCGKEGCVKSFDSGVKLKRHSRIHDPNRYFCSEPVCNGIPFFQTWTALQAHIRTDHPPTCTYRQCKGRTFTNRKNLKDHMKLHEQRREERAIERTMDSDPEDSYRDESPDAQLASSKRRRGGDLGRDWICNVNECEKAFKSKYALRNHKKVAHDKRLDFPCQEVGCRQTFGYKHVLQRHIQTCHTNEALLSQTVSGTDGQPSVSENLCIEPQLSGPSVPINPNSVKPTTFSIDDITGKSYNDKATLKPRILACPWSLPGSSGKEEALEAPVCRHIFSRLYDLRRHLMASHGVDMEISDLRDLMVEVGSAS